MSLSNYLNEFIRNHRRRMEINNFIPNLPGEENRSAANEESGTEDKRPGDELLSHSYQEAKDDSAERRESYKYGDDEREAVLEAAAILWQRLEEFFFGPDAVSDIRTIIDDIGEGSMGLIGPGNGMLTKILERLFGRSKTFRVHALPHDVAGRFRAHHRLGPGYLYTVGVKGKEGKVMRYARRVSVCGQVTGLVAAYKRRKEIRDAEQFQLVKIAVHTISL